NFVRQCWAGWCCGKAERFDEWLCNRQFVPPCHRAPVWRRGFFARTEPAFAPRGRGDGLDLCTFFGRRCSRGRARAIGGRCVAELPRRRRPPEVCATVAADVLFEKFLMFSPHNYGTGEIHLNRDRNQ